MKYFVLLVTLLLATPAQAEFIISSAILDYAPSAPRQQDVEVISRSKEDDYIVAEIAEIINPGQADEHRKVEDDPAASGLLVTPQKTVLAGGSRKALRFVVVEPSIEKERVYRVGIKPVIRGVEETGRIGLKVLVGYEVLVLVRPQNAAVAVTAKRQGKKLEITNRGNTNILLQEGQQCSGISDCAVAPATRVYAGSTVTLDLARDKPVTYTGWDGSKTIDLQFD